MLEKDLRGRRKIEKRSRKEKELRIRDNHPLPSFTHVRQTLGSIDRTRRIPCERKVVSEKEEIILLLKRGAWKEGQGR